jgi:hypothetical protein
MIYLTITIVLIFLVGMIHLCQLSKSYQQVIEEQNKKLEL